MIIYNQLGKTCKITAPSKEGNPTIVVQAFTGNGEWIGVKEEEIKVADCKLSFSYRKFVGLFTGVGDGVLPSTLYDFLKSRKKFPFR